LHRKNKRLLRKENEVTLKSMTTAVALTAALIAAPAHAGVIFSDNFDADNTASVLNFNSLVNWTVGSGTIDYIRHGGFGIGCVGGSGGCLDMDGSTGNAGRITSKQVFTFDSGVQYFIDVALSGNRRGGASDSVIVGIVQETTGTEIDLTFGPLAPSAAFGVFSVDFSGASAPGSWRLFAEGLGGDNIGAILDNYVLRDVRTATVAEPSTLLLTGLALFAAGAVRRRRR